MARPSSWNDVVAEYKLRQQEGAIDALRRDYIQELQKLTNRNVIVFYSGWLQKGAVLDRIGATPAIDDSDKNGLMAAVYQMDCSLGLDLVLHTPGGSIAATESIGDYLHAKFGSNIRAIVPQLAMSAGTMLCLGCNEIVMGKQSSLGPIDPQLGPGVSAGAILDAVANAVQDMKERPQTIPVWQNLLSRYTPHLVLEAKQALDWAIQLGTRWLNQNMFKSTAHEPTTQLLINSIVQNLAAHSISLSHERHLPVDYIKNLGLKVVPLESNQDLQDAVLKLHHVCMLTFMETGAFKFIENHMRKGVFQVLNAPLPAR